MFVKRSTEIILSAVITIGSAESRENIFVRVPHARRSFRVCCDRVYLSSIFVLRFFEGELSVVSIGVGERMGRLFRDAIHFDGKTRDAV